MQDNFYDSLEALCMEQRRIVKEIDELTQQKDQLSAQILTLMTEDKVVTTKYKITKVKQLSFKTSLEDARALNCTIMQEEVNKEALRRLYHNGVAIPDVKESEYIRITEKLLEK